MLAKVTLRNNVPHDLKDFFEGIRLPEEFLNKQWYVKYQLPIDNERGRQEFEFTYKLVVYPTSRWPEEYVFVSLRGKVLFAVCVTADSHLAFLQDVEMGFNNDEYRKSPEEIAKMQKAAEIIVEPLQVWTIEEARLGE